MAQSRLEKVGTIYSRATALIKSGAMKEETRPLWLDLYNAFPPKYEPRFDRPVSTAPIRQIFYPEDHLRARFHNDFKHFAMVNMMDKSVSKTEQFLVIYKQLETKGVPESELYEKAVEGFLENFKIEQSQREEAREARAQAREGRKQYVKKTQEGETKEAVSTEFTREERQKYQPIKFSLDKILKESDEDVKESDVKNTDEDTKKPE